MAMDVFLDFFRVEPRGAVVLRDRVLREMAALADLLVLFDLLKEAVESSL